MRWHTTQVAAAWMLSCMLFGLTGCGGGDSTPATSINAPDNTDASPGDSLSSSATQPTETTTVATTGPSRYQGVGAGTPAAPAGSRYSDAAPTATTPVSGNRYPSFANQQQVEVKVVTNVGDIRIRLFPDKAPLTVSNFLRNYVQSSFYEGSIVHFADPTMVAAGGFREDLSDIPSTLPIRCEANNGLKNVRGTVAMARLPEEIHSATSQFFFNVQDNADFDHRGETPDAFGYCVFGEVVEGMAVVDQIARSRTVDRGGFQSVPAETVVIRSVEVLK